MSYLPIAVDQKLGVRLSPIAGGLLGKHRRNKAAPEGSRQMAGWSEPPIRDENALWSIIDELVAIGQTRASRGRGSCAGMAPSPAGGDDPHHRRPDRGAVPRPAPRSGSS